MNVLILTPDRVGSTLLQRVLTVYMLRREFDRPVINLHELTNGLVKYYNNTLNQEVLGKPEGTQWGYHQSLDDIEQLLHSTDHYKTSRLAHYHIVNRKDTIGDQIKFYEYLNRNFYIISCRRRNLLEHALSWAIVGHSKKLNVYDANEKIDSFYDIYNHGVTVTEQGFKKYLTKYKEYIEWSDNYFHVQSYFNYEDHIDHLEDYILGLDFMKGHNNNTWKDMFGQDWDQYNGCHRLLPNLMLNKTTNGQPLWLPDPIVLQKWNDLRGNDWPLLPTEPVSNKLVELEVGEKFDVAELSKLHNHVIVDEPTHKFLTKNLEPYQSTNRQLRGLVDTGMMVTGIPLKLQTLKEKQQVVKNFDQCVEWHNQWAHDNGFGDAYTSDQLTDMGSAEEQTYQDVVNDIRRLT
jgi:hypothetical protein